MPFNRESKDNWAFFIFCSLLIIVAYLIYGIFQEPKYDVVVFYDIASEVKSGMVPYRDFFYEFPPLQLLYICIPIIFTDSLDTYYLIFSVMSSICLIFTMYFVVKICEIKNLNVKLSILMLTIIAIVFALCLCNKLDALIALIILASVYFYTKEKPVVALGISVVGALIKITPIFLTVVILLLMIFDKDKTTRIKNIAKSVFLSIVIFLLSIIPFLCLNTKLNQIFSFIVAHSERGIHIESTVGVVASLLNELGLIDATRYTYMDAPEIYCTLCQILTPICLPLIAILFILMIGYFIYISIKNKISYDSDSKFKLLLFGFSILMMTFLLFNKTFSTQFVIWLLPTAVLLTLTSTRIKLVHSFMIWIFIYVLSLHALTGITITYPFVFAIRLVLFIYLYVNYIIEFNMIMKQKFTTIEN